MYNNLILIIVFISILFIIFILHSKNKFQYREKYNFNLLREQYISLMKKIILNSVYEDGPWIIDGRSWPKGKALTMIGVRRMDNIYMLLKRVLDKRVNGDVIEAGCWRGGAMMFARSILNAYNENDRIVYMCDSFSGIPYYANSKYKQDRFAYKLKILNNNPVENVYTMLKRLDLKNGTVVVKGYFNETLERIPSYSFSLIRLDGDTYFSTMQAITTLYPKLSIGGYIIVDDYLDWASCKDAIIDYRRDHNIHEEIIEVYHEKGEEKRGVYWEKRKNAI